MKIKWKWGIGLGIVLSLVIGGLAFAATGPYGRDYGVGYLSGVENAGYNWVFVPTGNVDYYGLGSEPGQECQINCTVTEASFIAAYQERLYDTSSIVNQGRAAAEIDIMLGKQGPDFGNSIQAGITYAQDNFNQWVSLLNTYQNRTVPGYSVNWNADIPFGNITTNGMGATGPGSNLETCTAADNCIGDVSFVTGYNDAGDDYAVVFNVNGQQFIIKHKCANLTGDTDSLLIPSQPYKLQPAVTATVKDASGNITSDNAAEVGDTITFTYAVDNTGAGDSPATTCTTYRPPLEESGYYDGTTDEGTDNHGCGGFVSNTTTTVGSTSIVANTPNETICESLYVAQPTPVAGVAPAYDEACVPIVLMPYFKVYGGDVSAGNAQPSAACDPANDYDAGIVGWNTGSGLYDGAGTQFAALAIGDIDDFVTAQTAATAPSGLSFMNDPVADGTDGGDFGAGSLPCMNNYYDPPTGAQPLPVGGPDNSVDVGTLASGAYVYTGPSTITLYGTLPSGPNAARIEIFVDNHNAYISNDLTYQGDWNSLADIPLFELVVNNGDIYVASATSDLDGTYVAQNSAADGLGTGGQIATCATPTGPILGNDISVDCDNTLLVQGSFVADDIVLGRAPMFGQHTLSGSTTDSPASLTSNAAEQFDYGPANWLVQPPSPISAPTYNTADDLPPVL